MKRNNSLLLFTVLLICSLFIFAVKNNEKDRLAKKGTPQYFPEQVDFAGEQTPLHVADVKERLDRELLVNSYLHSSTILIMKRANRIFPIIEPILAKYGVPDDFKYLAVIESSLTNASSPAGAKGIWQFMQGTAKESGMEVNEFVDERYHLEKATEAACKYLISAKNKFGNWTLAAASYNGGINGINAKIDEQEVTSYYDLLLTDETSRYVFRILALKEIMRNPRSYGFDLSKEELYDFIPTKKVQVDSTITNLSTFAKAQGINFNYHYFNNSYNVFVLIFPKGENKATKTKIILK